MEIRLATLADEKFVCRLWAMLISYYRKETSPEILKRSFRYAVKHPNKVLIYIITIEGVVTGTLSLHLGHYSTWKDSFYGHLEDLIIDPAYRGQGLAAKLLQHVIAEARKHELSRLELNCLEGNNEARQLYEKCGFVTDSIVYEMSL